MGLADDALLCQCYFLLRAVKERGPLKTNLKKKTRSLSLPQILSLGITMAGTEQGDKKGRGESFTLSPALQKTMRPSYVFMHSHIFNICVPAEG